MAICREQAVAKGSTNTEQGEMQAVSLGLVLLLTWVLLSGHYTPFLLTLGVLSTVLSVSVALRMEVVDKESHPVHLTPRLFGYWAWLAREIVKASIDVTKRIWNPRMPITPAVFRLRASQPSELGQVIYANSITLTPGTVTMRLGDGELYVHAIAGDVGEDLAGGGGSS